MLRYFLGILGLILGLTACGGEFVEGEDLDIQVQGINQDSPVLKVRLIEGRLDIQGWDRAGSPDPIPPRDPKERRSLGHSGSEREGSQDPIPPKLPRESKTPLEVEAEKLVEPGELVSGSPDPIPPKLPRLWMFQRSE